MKKIKLTQQQLPEEGKAKSIYIDKKEFCIVRKDNQYYAIDDSCPHAGASLGMGKCQNDWIVCPKHDIRFNYKTGKGQTEKFSVSSYRIIFEKGDFFIAVNE